jgi:hypothetical protein
MRRERGGWLGGEGSTQQPIQRHKINETQAHVYMHKHTTSKIRAYGFVALFDDAYGEGELSSYRKKRSHNTRSMTEVASS